MPFAVAGAAIGAGAAIYDTSQQIGAAKSAIAPLQGAQQTEYGDAESIANTPYTAYTGQQVAPITGSQQQAITQATTDAGANNPAASDINASAAEAAQIAGNGWSSATAAKYMNPYTQNVTNVAQSQMQQQYANTINQQGLSAASTGAFGGDRATLTNENTTGQYLYQSGNLAAQNQAAAYNSAVQTWQADNQRSASAATAYQNAGNDITQMNSSQIKDLLATGGVAQATQQMQLNANYNDYLDQRGWAANELQPLIAATGGKGTPANPAPAPIASDLVGMGSALAGYFGSTGSNSNYNPAGETAAANSSLNVDTDSSVNSALNNYSPSISGDAIGSTPIGSQSSTPFGSGYYSDYALKDCVEPFFFDHTAGLQVYSFRYKDEAGRWFGYMAQDVQKKYPDAVSRGPQGFLKVHYGKIPAAQLRKPTPAEWGELDALLALQE